LKKICQAAAYEQVQKRLYAIFDRFAQDIKGVYKVSNSQKY
jgi:hypothetical protein